MTIRYDYAITHGGKAHRDDFLASCIALATGARAVERRNPDADEVINPAVLILDVGGQHDPDKSNFDHHHLSRDSAPTCALTLYLRHLGLEGQFRRLGWLEPTELLDSKGPMQYGRAYGLSPENVFRTFSPVEEALLDEFSTRERVLGYPLHNSLTGVDFIDSLGEVMKALGKRLLDDATKLQADVERLQRQAQLVDVAGVTCMVIPSKDTNGSREFRKEFAPTVAVSISHDDRGSGWALFRYDDDPRVDFSRLEGNPAVMFAHKGGFIAKTSSLLPLDEVLDLVRASLR